MRWFIALNIMICILRVAWNIHEIRCRLFSFYLANYELEPIIYLNSKVPFSAITKHANKG
jgi:hypothetical protein